MGHMCALRGKGALREFLPKPSYRTPLFVHALAGRRLEVARAATADFRNESYSGRRDFSLGGRGGERGMCLCVCESCG